MISSQTVVEGSQIVVVTSVLAALSNLSSSSAAGPELVQYSAADWAQRVQVEEHC